MLDVISIVGSEIENVQEDIKDSDLLSAFFFTGSEPKQQEKSK